MSGFEVAGITLAVFPILVDGMVRFVDGVQTIKYWRRYRVRLQEYADIIGTQGVYYQDTLEELLTGIVQSEDEIKDLLAEPRGAIWKKPEYEAKLRQRLGRSHAVYMSMSDKMVNALYSMCEKLGIDSSGKLLPDDVSRVEREMKRIKLTLSKNIYKETLDIIDKANKDLRDITHQNIYLEPIRQKRRSKHPLAQLKIIRKHAASLYRVFITGISWNCSCRMLHMASLRLEQRPDGLEALNADSVPKVRFRILLSTGQGEENSWVSSQWQEVEIMPSLDQIVASATSVGSENSSRGVRSGSDLMSTTTVGSSQTTVFNYDYKSIADLCSILCANQEPANAIGYLVDEEDNKQKHYLYRANTTISPERRSKSLDDLLSCSGHGSRSPPLSRNDRLRIAVTLASSVLQLDGTSWLKSQWSSKDILFHEKNNRANDPNYTYPYVSRKLCRTDNSVLKFFDSFFRGTYVVRIEVLFALGLTLIELCFGKTIADMHIPDDGDPEESTTVIKTAHRLGRSVYSEMGTSYGDAVRRCLYQPFDVRDLSLDNEKLQQKVFDDIITPLNDDWLIFNGKVVVR